MSFRKTLITTTVFFAIIPIIILSIIFVYIARDRVIYAEEDALATLAISNGGALNQIIIGQEREIRLMSNNNAIKYYIENQGSITSASLKNSRSALDKAIEVWVDSYDEYEDAVFINNSGYIVASYHEDNIGYYVGEEDFFKQIVANYKYNNLKQTIISNKKESINNEDGYSIIISHPIIEEESQLLKGVIALHISVNFFRDFIDNVNIGYGRTAYIVDGNNKVIFHPEANYINSEILSPVLLSKINELRNEETIDGYDLITYSQDNSKMLSSLFLIEEADWILVISKTWESVLNPLNIVIIIVFLASLLSIIIATIVSRLITNHYMIPINNLKNTIGRVQSENKYIPCDVTTRNEFGQLAEGYNMMIRQLSNNAKENYYLAYKDRITGLHNHYAILRELRETIKNQKPFAVLFLDLDDFKTVNELFGHRSGNETLIEFAKILDNIDDIPKITGRYGGDEFIVIVEAGENQVTNYALKIIERLKEPIKIGNNSLKISSSIGISFYPTNGKTGDELIKNADIAMYDAKKSGKNNLVIFNQMLENKIIRENKIVNILKNCIKNDEIYPVFQPEVDFKTNKIIGFEALVRLKSKEIGFISPAEFIPIAESSNYISEIGYWMLEKSCEFLKKLIDDGYDLEFVSVNLSPIQLMDANFVSYVVQILEKTNLEPQHLQVEITESLIMQNIESCVYKLLKLRQLGITVALDDFGTSYSSLNYLINLPIDTLKIDKSFVDDICEENKKLVIVRSIVNMAHNIGLNVVAEGVETEVQRDLLTIENCDLMQGYFYSKPLEEKDVIKLLEKNK